MRESTPQEYAAAMDRLAAAWPEHARRMGWGKMTNPMLMPFKGKRPDVPLCRDCKHAYEYFGRVSDVCTALGEPEPKMSMNLKDGSMHEDWSGVKEPYLMADVRGPAGKCGPEGRLFEAAQKRGVETP